MHTYIYMIGTITGIKKYEPYENTDYLYYQNQILLWLSMPERKRKKEICS
jgi:hypothetical protein